ncbi:Guanylate kinase [Blautia glucerasea]|uniref:Guanylate kinase n=2 Tax=Lachnospiraceae TaxID=186803 RepID=A0A6N2S6Q6_9FIRM
MKIEEKNMSKGVLAVVSGFSGAGKGTVMKRLLERYDNYALSVSVTTRQPRPGEEDGREYFFRTREEVEKMIKEDQLLEYAQYVDNYYGTPRFYVEEMLSQGKNVILEIEIQGAMKIKEKIPEAVLIFVTPPSVQELKSRLEGRGTEAPEVIASRLSRASEEAEGMEDYDYLLVNDELDECVSELHQIISSERCRTQRNTEYIKRIQEESRELMKGDL